MQKTEIWILFSPNSIPISKNPSGSLFYCAFSNVYLFLKKNNLMVYQWCQIGGTAYPFHLQAPFQLWKSIHWEYRDCFGLEAEIKPAEITPLCSLLRAGIYSCCMRRDFYFLSNWFIRELTWLSYCFILFEMLAVIILEYHSFWSLSKKSLCDVKILEPTLDYIYSNLMGVMFILSIIPFFWGIPTTIMFLTMTSFWQKTLTHKNKLLRY